MPNFVHDDQPSRSAIFNVVPNSLLTFSHQTIIDSAKTPSRSTAILNLLLEIFGKPPFSGREVYNLENQTSKTCVKTIEPIGLKETLKTDSIAGASRPSHRE